MHAESYRSGFSKVVIGGGLIEYTPQRKWGRGLWRSRQWSPAEPGRK